MIRILLVGVLIAAIAGCDRHTKHKVLTFFFTGVPPLDDGKKAEAEKTEPPEVPTTEQKSILAPKRFSHPLWAAGRCDQCHQTSANFSVPGVKKRMPAVFQKGMEPPGPLVVPRQELCVRCHTDKSPAKAQQEGLWLHNTQAKGECHKCHDPHQSDHQYLLLETPRLICIPCHKEAEMMPKVKDKEAHKKPGECLSCHNPHLGKDRNLLTKDYKEVKHPVSLVPDLPGAEASPIGFPGRGSTSQE